MVVPRHSSSTTYFLSLYRTSGVNLWRTETSLHGRKKNEARFDEKTVSMRLHRRMSEKNSEKTSDERGVSVAVALIKTSG